MNAKFLILSATVSTSVFGKTPYSELKAVERTSLSTKVEIEKRGLDTSANILSNSKSSDLVLDILEFLGVIKKSVELQGGSECGSGPTL